MIEATEFDAIVTRAGYVRTGEGELRCFDAERLPVGSRVQVELHSDWRGDHAVLAGAASSVFAGINGRLEVKKQRSFSSFAPIP